MKKIRIEMLVTVALSLSIGSAWAVSVNDEALCSAWSSRAAALNQRRSGNQMLEFHANWARMTTIKDFKQAGKALGMTDEQITAALSSLPDQSDTAPLDPKQSALSRVSESLAVVQEQTRAVLEWEVFLKERNIEVLPVPKSQYPAFVDRIIATVGAASSSDIDPIKQKLMGGPQNLSSLIPGVQVETCGDTYLFYQSKATMPAGLATQDTVTLGNVAKIWGNSVSVSGYQSSPANAPYGDKGLVIAIQTLLNNP